MAKPDLGDYIEVKDRIARFHREFPEPSLQSSWRVVEIAGDTLIVAEARAYRTPDDRRPGVGHASEPYPGKTPYTKDSEVMNAETSAWGRALAALGLEVSRAIASREEVTAREGNGQTTPQIRNPDDFATAAQKRKVTAELNQRIAKQHHDALRAAFKADTKGGASKLVEALLSSPNIAALLIEHGIQPASDVPVDTEGLPPAPSEEELSQLGLKADDE